MFVSSQSQQQLHSARRRLQSAAMEALESRQLFAAGGGWTDAGLVGEYFNNVTLSAPAAFTRRDVRINFDWSTTGKPGGSNSIGFRDVGADNFSVRWTGKVIPNFSETYTFKVFADDAFKLELKATSASVWNTVIDQTAYVGADRTGSFAMTAGQKYDVRITFIENTGAASVRLRWSSPSTPQEVIDTVVEMGTNIEGGFRAAYSDIIRGGGRNSWIAGNVTIPMDSLGWPMADGSFVFQESLNQGLGIDPLERGTIHFSFNGRATIKVQGNAVQTSVVSSYDSHTNTTTGTFTTQDNSVNATYFMFSNTDRDGDFGADGIADKDGITNLKLIKPVAPDSTTGLDPEAIFDPHYKQAIMDHFTNLRVHLNNGNQESSWSDRTSPTWFNQNLGRSIPRVYSTGSDKRNGPSWEHKIMFANETGRDLYINIPMMAAGWTPSDTTSYIYKLAQLLKYGSDANGNPYSAPQSNPAYPPLNPNLRVYIELSNEYWNSLSDAFRQYWDLNAMVTASADEYLSGFSSDPRARGEDFPIFNYDNLPTTKNASGAYNSMDTWRKRFIGMRLVQISDIFRSVFGNAQMPDSGPQSRIRPLFMWQYENSSNTALDALQFLENYYNNGDGITHVASPHPVSYYIFGGGGATYYGSLNSFGVTDQMNNPSFETPALAAGYTQAPAGAGWAFTGTAGIARDAGSADDIPPAWEGSQMAYLTGSGTMEQSFTLPATATSNVYAISFKSVQHTPAGGTANTQKFQVFIDGVAANARSFSQSGGYQPTAYSSSAPWNAQVVASVQSPYYQTLTFTGTPGSTHSVKFVGVGAADQIAFIEDVRVSSIDAIFAGSMPSGGSFAAGQTGSGAYAERLEAQASWAAAYGLIYNSYEGGWALGGDTGGSPLQNHAKYIDSRAATVNHDALDYFIKAGGHVNTYGVYSQWPSWSSSTAQQGLLDVAAYPLVQGQDAFLGSVPAAIDNGYALSASLTLTAAQKTIDFRNTNGALTTGGWLSWNVIAPTAGQYNISVNAGSGGSVQVLVDGKIVDTYSSADALTHAPTNITLTRGLHTIRVKAVAGAFSITDVGVKSGPGAQAGPALAVYDGQGMLQTETTMAPDSIAVGVNASSIALGPGVKITNNAAFKNGLIIAPADNNDPTTFTGAIAGNDYAFFTISPAAGKTISLSKLSLNLWIQNNGFGVGLQYSTDGTNFTTVGQYDYTGTPAGMTDFDLSAITALQNVSGEVTFRIYFWNYGNYGSVAIGNWSGNDMIVYGSLATPASAATEVIVDNTDASGITITGAWISSTYYPGYYGSNYMHDGNAGKGTKSVRYTPTLTASSFYEVFAIWTADSNRDAAVPFDINYSGGTSTVFVNQQINNGVWVSLGAYAFNAGTSGNVLIRNTGTTGYVMADAIRFVPVTAAPTILDSTDPSGITITGAWTSSTYYPGYYGSDYLHDGNTGKGTKSVRYTPTLLASGNYEVFTLASAASNRATNIPFDISHAAGTSTVLVNQQINNGVWVSLGIYAFTAGTSGNVLIRTDGTTGYVAADAIKFVPVT